MIIKQYRLGCNVFINMVIISWNNFIFANNHMKGSNLCDILTRY